MAATKTIVSAITTSDSSHAPAPAIAVASASRLHAVTSSIAALVMASAPTRAQSGTTGGQPWAIA